MSEIETLSLLFDSAWYLATYQDVTLANCDPLEHYLSFGYKEGRNPNRFFNTKFYLSTYTDIAECHLNPFIHYILYGASEGRLPRPPHVSPLPPITFEVFLEEDETENIIEKHDVIVEKNTNKAKETTSKVVKQESIATPQKSKTTKKNTKKDNVALNNGKENTNLKTITKDMKKVRTSTTKGNDTSLNNIKAITKDIEKTNTQIAKDSNASLDNIDIKNNNQNVTKSKKEIKRPIIQTRKKVKS